MMSIHIYTTSSAPAPVAIWLQRLLAPVISAANIETPPPIELRNCGRWSGWCADRGSAPDSRIALSKTLLFSTQHRLASVYIHEVCHRLGADEHDALFFALQLLLYQRVDAKDIFEQKLALSPNLYDIQDAPHPLGDEPRSAWLPQSIAWAVRQAESLSGTDSTAEALFSLLSARHDAWLSTLKTSVEIERRAARVVEERRDLRQTIFIRTYLALAGWAGVLFLSIGFVRYAIANH